MHGISSLTDGVFCDTLPLWPGDKPSAQGDYLGDIFPVFLFSGKKLVAVEPRNKAHVTAWDKIALFYGFRLLSWGDPGEGLFLLSAFPPFVWA